jgi:hypothetical protein
MRSVYEARVAEQIEIGGRLVSGADTFVPPPQWAAMARVLWPLKTAAHLATLAGKDVKSAKRWLSGEFDPPGIIYAALILEMHGFDSARLLRRSNE